MEPINKKQSLLGLYRYDSLYNICIDQVKTLIQNRGLAIKLCGIIMLNSHYFFFLVLFLLSYVKDPTKSIINPVLPKTIFHDYLLLDKKWVSYCIERATETGMGNSTIRNKNPLPPFIDNIQIILILFI